MSQQFTQTKTLGWGTRLIRSIKGVLIGLGMFVFSFGLLYWNEGRVNIANIAKTATEISATTNPSIEHDQQPVSTTGTIQSQDVIGDTFLQEGQYLSLRRNVEMYAWDEKEESTSQTNVGGSEKTETTYTYTKTWTRTPDDSSTFKQPDDHENPPMPIDQYTVHVPTATIGIYTLDTKQLTFPPHNQLQLNNANVILTDDMQQVNDQYLFQGKGTFGAPEVGDIRVHYSVVSNPIDNVTVFGKLNTSTNRIDPYYGAKNTNLYRAFEGARDTAITTMQMEHTLLLWVLRIGGFLLMWFGLMALFGPIGVILDVLPILGSIGRLGVGVVTFVISTTLTILTIVISITLNNPFLLVGIVVLTIIGIAIYLKTRPPRVPSPPTTPPQQTLPSNNQQYSA